MIEQRLRPPKGSMAIGITPPSLDILDRLDLKSEFVRNGVMIRNARIFENRQPVGELNFRDSENSILSFPQIGTIELLEKKAATYDTVRIKRGKAFTEEDLKNAPGWVIACDGSHGSLRETAGIGGTGSFYGVSFVMADFPDLEGLGADARLYFSAAGAVESFPLPGSKRRWIAQVPRDAELQTLMDRVEAAAGIDLRNRSSSPLCSFSPRWFLADTFRRGNVFLCGDSGHVMSPIGGQGMNTGFGDAMMLSEILQHPDPAAQAAYTRERRRAFRIAARRAALGMWLGTRKGPAASLLRAWGLKTGLRAPWTQQTLVRSFSMRNLPHPCNP